MRSLFALLDYPLAPLARRHARRTPPAKKPVAIRVA